GEIGYAARRGVPRRWYGSAGFLAAAAGASGRGRNDLRGGVHQAFLHRLPRGHVALGEVVQGVPGRLPHQAVQLAAELRLLVEKYLQTALEIRTHEALQRIAVETDDLAEQLGREHRLALVLMLGDDLQQNRAGQVLAALGV